MDNTTAQQSPVSEFSAKLEEFLTIIQAEADAFEAATDAEKQELLPQAKARLGDMTRLAGALESKLKPHS